MTPLRDNKGRFIAGGLCITRKGYRRIWVRSERRKRMEHNVVWEKYFGSIPKGFEIHHKDRNKLNNHITNLQLVDDLTQKRLHSDCKIVGGRWYKRCRQCCVVKSVDEYYKVYGKCIQSICKKCQIKNSVRNKIKRRERKKDEQVLERRAFAGSI
jgi:hypothetical protein